MQPLSASVGLAGDNRRHDVAAVQRALLAAGYSPGPIDSLCGRHTLGAIVAFQRSFMHDPDARVDPHGPTCRRLEAYALHTVASGSSATSHRPTSSSPQALAAPPRAAPAFGGSPPPPHVGPAATPSGATIRYTDHLPMPSPGSVNRGLRSPPNSVLKGAFGMPRDDFGSDCRPPTNTRIKAAIATEDVGPFRVTGLRPALESLRTVFADVRRDTPDLYGVLSTAGMLCCRHVRGSSSVSNHSWGTAIDMQIDGMLESRGSNYVLAGLAMLAPAFNRRGWFWGAGYQRIKDPHHFECGTALVESFKI